MRVRNTLTSVIYIQARSRGVHGVGSHPLSGSEGKYFDTQGTTVRVQSIKIKDTSKF